MFNRVQCKRCSSKIKEDFSFCPHCGLDQRNPQKELEQFGMLGRDDNNIAAPMIGGGSFGFSDKIFSSIFNQLMKSIEGQMNAKSGEGSIEHFPNGITINLSPVAKQQQQPRARKRAISEEQVKRMAGLPRTEGKTSVRRLSDKVVYEIKTSGVNSVQDVFVSKVESGYEVKAIGDKKVYVNTLAVDLPLKAYAVTENGLEMEFGLN